MVDFQALLDAERARRARELSDARALYINAADVHKIVAGHALIVLFYAHWEGFLNSCVKIYVDVANNLPACPFDVRAALIASEAERHFQSAIDRRFSFKSKIALLEAVGNLAKKQSVLHDRKVLGAASNLDFPRLVEVFEALGIELGNLSHTKNFIHKELVGWRHQVAHGDAPSLEQADLVRHSHATEELLLSMSERFADKFHALIGAHTARPSPLPPPLPTQAPP